ncbi:hypothetical protein DFH07DRAFT_803476 [Mycena maculata]|uniref:Uncharacterized protein n=1 Tax=Mycena maculata TaxID=230809 RepID=A0AAD7NRD1_9AGAR|nr:hypothetical protein DFH07DRAFT_803476 [Mycena maculata]
MSRGYQIRPQRLVIADQDGRFPDSERAKLQPISPSEWIGANVQAKKMFLGAGRLSPVESENRSPLDTSSSISSPATPRPWSYSVMGHSKPGGDLDTPMYVSRSPTIAETPDAELTEHRRRPRSASEPRSFLVPFIEVPRHAGTVPPTPTEYLVPVAETESDGPKSFSISAVSLPPRKSSHHNPMPEDVYFTAAGRRESRIYIPPDAAPNSVSLSPRGHAYSSSDPVFSAELGGPPARHATWSGSRKKEPSSARPFADVHLPGMASSADEDNTPVSRKEELWSGEWNRDDIQEVIKELRSLK